MLPRPIQEKIERAFGLPFNKIKAIQAVTHVGQPIGSWLMKGSDDASSELSSGATGLSSHNHTEDRKDSLPSKPGCKPISSHRETTTVPSFTMSQSAQALPAGACEEKSATHPDGPESGCWLWRRGKRFDIPKGTIWRLLDYMWTRESASYSDLEGPVFDTLVEPGTIRARASELNRLLRKIGVPWRLKPNAVSRYLTKQPTD